MMVRRIAVPLVFALCALGACSENGAGGSDDGYGSDWRGRIEDLLNGGGSVGASGPDTEVPTTSPQLTRYVATDGDDGNPGTRDKPWRTPAHAVRNAKPGMRILMRGGSYPAFTIDAVDGSAASPILLAAAPGSRPVISGGTVLVRRAYWQLEGLEVKPGNAVGVRFTGAGAHHDVLRGSVVHDGSAASGVSVDLGATYVTIEGNEIFAIWRGNDVDAHGVVIQPDAVGVRILGNEIHGTSGDSIQCIGPNQDAPGGAPARDLLIEGNLLYADRENAVDIKWCEGVTVRGNVMRGFRKSSTSNGEAVVIHRGARDVLVEYNDISESSRGVVTGVGAHDVRVRRNVIHTPVDERTGILFGEGTNPVASHNTVVGAARCVGVLAEAKGAVVTNNILVGCGQSVTGSAEVANNLFHQAPATGSGAVTGDPLLDGDFRPSAGSPAIDHATVVDDDPVCGNGPDIGAVERC